MSTKSELIATLAAQAYAVVKEEEVKVSFLPSNMKKIKVIYLAARGDIVVPSSAEMVVKDGGTPGEDAKWLGGSPIQTVNQLYEDVVNSAAFKDNNGRVIREYKNGLVVSVLKDTAGVLEEVYKFIDKDEQNKIRVRDVTKVINSGV